MDGDSFFASCEIALNPKLDARPVWVGGGRRGDGILIAANRTAKNFGIKTAMACFEAARLCPRGVLCRTHYDEYRDTVAPHVPRAGYAAHTPGPHRRRTLGRAR